MFHAAVMCLRYADYNLPDGLLQMDAHQNRSETTFDIRYSIKQASGFGMATQLDELSSEGVLMVGSSY